MKDILVCPIAFNEHVKLQTTIERFLVSGMRGRADYLVMDDGSTDGTTDMIRSFAPQGVKTIRHEHRRGVGAAIRTAIRYAMENHYRVIVIMAGNNKDNPEEMPRLIDPILSDGCHLVQGSRYLEKDGTGGAMPLYRRFATKMHPWLLSVITGKKVTDSTNGYRAIDLSVFKDPRINLDQAWLDTYELEPYILYKILKLNYKFKEGQVTKVYPPKKLGYTKMKPISGWWSILRPLFLLGLGLKK